MLFLFVLYLSKIVALSSIVSAVGVTVYVLLFCKDTPVTVALGILTLMLFYRHRGNFLPIIKGTENKVKWL